MDGCWRMPMSLRGRPLVVERRDCPVSRSWLFRPACPALPESWSPREQAHLSAEQPSAGQDPWLPVADADPGWTGHPRWSPRQGPRQSVRLTPGAFRPAAAATEPRLSRYRPPRSSRWRPTGSTRCSYQRPRPGAADRDVCSAGLHAAPGGGGGFSCGGRSGGAIDGQAATAPPLA